MSSDKLNDLDIKYIVGSCKEIKELKRKIALFSKHYDIIGKGSVNVEITQDTFTSIIPRKSSEIKRVLRTEYRGGAIESEITEGFLLEVSKDFISTLIDGTPFTVRYYPLM